MAIRRFESGKGRTTKFWHISVTGALQLVKFGRIGSSGQQRVKRFSSPEAAQADTETLIRQKLSKGYREPGAAPVAVKGKAAVKTKAPAKAPAAPKAKKKKNDIEIVDAAKTDDVEGLKKLLAAGGDPDSVDKGGATGLMWAARDGRAQVIAALLKAGASPALEAKNVKKGTTFSALTLASKKGHEKIVKMLLAAGAPATKQALDIAAERGQMGVVAILGEAGAGNSKLAGEFQKAFGFLCESKSDAEVLLALSYRVDAIKKKGGGLTVTIGGEKVECAPPARVKSSHVPKSYAALASHFNGISWESAGGGEVGFPGLNGGAPASDFGFDSSYLENDEAFARVLKKSNSTTAIPAFGCAQNWLLFDPTRKNKRGEDALAFVSHESCEWEPVRSADKLSAAGILLRLLARYFLDTDDLEEISL